MSAGHVYWTGGGTQVPSPGTAVKRMPLGGGAVETLTSPLPSANSPVIWGFVIVGSTMFFSTE